MKKSKPCSISELAKTCNRDVDDILITLWDAGFDELNEPSNVLSGYRLDEAKRILAIPRKNQLTSIIYWQNILSVDEDEFRKILHKMGFDMSPNAVRIPQGSIKKLNSFSKNRKKLTSSPVPDFSSSLSQVSKPVNYQSFEWTTIGHIRDVKRLTLDEVLSIHDILVEDFAEKNDPIDPPGPRNDDIISSAVFRQNTSLGNQLKYPTVEMCAAALLHSIVHDHPFHNGNKRTALVSMLVLLDENKMMLYCDEDELFRYIIQVAQHRIVNDTDFLSDREVIHISKWIKERSRQKEFGDRPLPLRKLKSILLKYDCNIDHSSTGNNIKISRELEIKTNIFSRKKNRTLTTNISCGGDNRDVSCSGIKKVRKELELDENNGIDSASFYDDLPSVISSFIITYRKSLTRLAKL